MATGWFGSDYKMSKMKKRLVFYGTSLSIIGALLWIAIPTQLCDHGTRSKISSIKSNMHTIQTMVETYAFEHKGQFPPNMQVLKQDAAQGDRPYWKDFTNPYNGKTGQDISYADEGKMIVGGLATYQPIGSPPTSYLIYGYSKTKTRLQQKGQDFYLSNMLASEKPPKVSAK